MPNIQTIGIKIAYKDINLGAKMDLFVARFGWGEMWERIVKIEKTKISRQTYYEITTASGHKTGAYTGEKITVIMVKDGE